MKALSVCLPSRPSIPPLLSKIPPRYVHLDGFGHSLFRHDAFFWGRGTRKREIFIRDGIISNPIMLSDD